MDANRILRQKIEGSLSKAKKVISSIADSVILPDSDNYLEYVIAALAKTVIAPDRMLNSSDIEDFRMVWGKNFSAENTDKIVAFLYDSTEITVDEAAGAAKNITPELRKKILLNLCELLVNADSPDEAEKFLKELASAFELSEKDFDEVLTNAKNKGAKRKKLLSSGAGILAALIILLIFILTATWLKSVIFGLALAALMFPVEQYFERKFERKKGMLYHFFALCGRCESSIKDKIKLTASNIRPTAAEKKKYERELWIRNSVSMSCAILIILLLGIFILFGAISANYISSTRESVKNFMNNAKQQQTGTAENQSGSSKKEPQKNTIGQNAFAGVMSGIHKFLEENRQRFESQPVIKNTLNKISEILSRPDTQQQIFSILIKKTGGLINLTTGFLSALAVFLLDILLTIFFFLLFLTKLAQFAQSHKDKKHNYIVRTLFSGNWLPRTSEEDIQETELIINEILHKLKVWLRGYLSLMLIDFTVYSTVFYFLNVPYFFILGAIAGCGILLPFIGPIISCCLTFFVTLACGDASAMQLLGIIGIYLLHNGITEQFILYPTVIGESLGLTTLETIIVVLLGGIFAGATGMIFSIPTAAVIKYLVPRIHHYLQAEK